MKQIGHIVVAAITALTLYACSGPSEPDCSGDGVITSESHWANCGQNGITNASTNNSYSDAGFNTGANGGNAVTNNDEPGNNTFADTGSTHDAGDSGADAGADAETDAGTDAGTLESCYAFRWNDTDLTFDTARCNDTGAGTFNCSCFDAGDTMSIALTCDQALTECGATFQEVESCAMTETAGCTPAADGGWECTCLDSQETVASNAERCDTAYWSSCYSDNFCESSLTDGTARCEPSLDTDYNATGYTCACYQDGVEVKPPVLQSGASCIDDASAYCSDI